MVDFPDTEIGQKILDTLVAISDCQECDIIQAVYSVCERESVLVASIVEDDELLGFEFPQHNWELHRWGPDPTPCWVPSDLEVQS